MPEKTDSASLLLLGRNAKPGSQGYTCVKRLSNMTKTRVTKIFTCAVRDAEGEAG